MITLKFILVHDIYLVWNKSFLHHSHVLCDGYIWGIEYLCEYENISQLVNILFYFYSLISLLASAPKIQYQSTTWENNY